MIKRDYAGAMTIEDLATEVRKKMQEGWLPIRALSIALITPLWPLPFPD